MGGFEEHLGDHSLLYPVASLVVGVVVFWLTGDGLVTVASLVVGYPLLLFGLLAPDVDLRHSVVHRRVEVAVFRTLVVATVAWALVSDVGQSVGLVVGLDAALAGLSDWSVFWLLVAASLLWWGYTEPHRDNNHRALPHERTWGAAMTGALALAVWFALPGFDPVGRVAVATGVAAQFLVGFLGHLDRDGEIRGDGPSYVDAE